MEDGQFCRLCLTSSVVYYSLFKNNGKEMVLSLTGIELTEDDVSTESCAKCWLDLKLAYFIQQCFLQANTKLKNTLIEPEITESKIEVEDDEEPLETNSDKDDDNDITEDQGTRKADNDNLENNDKIEDFTEENDNMMNLDNVEGNDNISYEDGELIYIQAEPNVEKPSMCSICGIKCQDEMNLYNHISTHYDGPQMCDECLVSFPNIPAYRSHFQIVHPKLYIQTHICGICQLSFRYRSLYNLHLVSLHSKTAKSRKRKRAIVETILEADSYECETCSKVFTSKRLYHVHLQNHKKKECPICGALITNPNISKHILSHQMEPSVCDLCGITCKHSESLRWHKYNSHSNLKKQVCEICGKAFKKMYNLKIHLKKHSGERNYSCDKCGKSFFTQCRLNIHIRLTHLKERSHLCKYCGQAFSKRDALRTHERIHTNELPYVCEVCGVGFRQNISLRSHRKSKHNIVEIKTTECPECSKMFKDGWALLTHMRSVHA